MAQKFFTIYLLNYRVSSFEEAHRIVDPIVSLPLGKVAGESVDGRALFVQNSKPPPWLKVALPFWGIETEALYTELEVQESADKHSLLNVNNSCLILFKKYDRFFAVTYGPAARWKLPEEEVVDDFGLKVVLNAVEPTKLNRVSTKRVAGDVDFDTDRYASALVRLEQFGLIASDEFMTVLAGKPEDHSYAVRITGGKGLNVVVNTEDFSLDAFIQKTLGYYKSTQYREKFPFYEKGVEAVTDQQLLNSLNQSLLERLSSPDAIVGIVSLRNEQVEPSSIRLVLEDGTESEIVSIFDWDFIEGFLEENRRTRSDLCNASVVLRYPGSDSIVRRFTHIITADIKRAEGTYFYYADNWSKFDKDYLQRKEVELRALVKFVPDMFPAFDPNIDFKVTAKGVTAEEEKYIERVCASNKTLHNFDRELMENLGYRGRGNEFCDILGDNLDLIHIKRGNSLGPISYVLHQGLGSLHMAFNSNSFRAGILDALEEPLKSKLGNADSSDVAVVFAIINSSQEEGFEFLPLSGKLALCDIASIIKTEFRASVILTRIEQKAAAEDWKQTAIAIAETQRLAEEIADVDEKTGD